MLCCTNIALCRNASSCAPRDRNALDLVKNREKKTSYHQLKLYQQRPFNIDEIYKINLKCFSTMISEERRENQPKIKEQL